MVVDYAAVEDGVYENEAGGVSIHVPQLQHYAFLDAATCVERLASGAEFSVEWARKTELRMPAVIASAEGLGLEVPGPSFCVRDVAKAIGEDTPAREPSGSHRRVSRAPSARVSKALPRRASRGALLRCKSCARGTRRVWSTGRSATGRGTGSRSGARRS